MTGLILRDHNREQWKSKSDADPETPRHAREFRISRIGGYVARFKRHSADGASARPVADYFGMHRARVFRARGGRCYRRGFERHATLGTIARPRFMHLGMHG